MLALDPGESAGEILRLRREFLGRAPAAAPADDPSVHAEARAAAARRREEEARARAAALTKAHRLRRPIESTRQAASPESSGFDWRWFIAIYVILQVIRAVTKDR